MARIMLEASFQLAAAPVLQTQDRPKLRKLHAAKVLTVLTSLAQRVQGFDERPDFILKVQKLCGIFSSRCAWLTGSSPGLSCEGLKTRRA